MPETGTDSSSGFSGKELNEGFCSSEEDDRDDDDSVMEADCNVSVPVCIAASTSELFTLYKHQLIHFYCSADWKQ